MDAAPICTNTQARCHVLSLANLFDQIIQHSARMMHDISNDLQSEFVSILVQFLSLCFSIFVTMCGTSMDSLHHQTNGLILVKCFSMHCSTLKVLSHNLMLMLGIINSSISSQASPEASLPSDSAEWRLMKDNDLLYCFR
uniref:Uncharacterized protein n=1 Tax=Monopterus albus TaxID=43700 RepID=A0A3Q3QSI4_MONAL